MMIEIIFFALIICLAIILCVDSWILLKTNRNSWDILYLNSVLVILVLLFIGLIANDSGVWKFVVSALSIVAAGEKLSSVLQSRENRPIKTPQ